MERKSKPGEMINLRELLTQHDVIHELGMYNHKDITKEQSKILFYRISEAIKDLPVADDVTTVINLTIDGVQFHITLQPVNERLALSVTQSTQAPTPRSF